MDSSISYRAGVDIGGTFTDIVLVDNRGRVFTKKVSSTPADYGQAIVDGLTAMLSELGGHPSQIEELVHATTIATNTVLEGKGARTALITTRGFRDVIEVGRLRVPCLYNLGYTKPVPLALRRHRFEVTERLRADGSVEVPLDERDMMAVVERLQSEGIEAVAVSFLHAYANPEHEKAVRRILEAAFGDRLYVSCSHEILPEIREYERTSTTVVNAYLGPVVVSYVRTLIAKLRDIGMRGPVRVMHSNGGVMSAEAVMARPAAIIESGPAAGVIAGAFVASHSGHADTITIDMGGTTAKAAIIEAGQPARTTEYEVGAGINLSSKLVKGGGHAVKLPFIDVSEIGAGGGSKVRMDAGGLLRVGPDSAGSSPGPVCYGAGGETATLTDAVVTLGYLNPRHLAGGELPIYAEKARAALQEQIAGPAGIPLHEAAYGVYSIAAATMTRAVKAVSTSRGRYPRDFALFAFGGNGPVIAHEIAALMDMRTVVVPPSPGVFSALGLLYSDTQHEEMQTLMRPLDRLAPGELEAAFQRLHERVAASLPVGDDRRSDVHFQYALDLRYAEQAYELTVPLAAQPDRPIDMATVVAAFHEEHRRTYGHASPNEPIEMVNLRLTATMGRSQAQRYDGSRVGHAMPGRPARQTRQAYFGQVHGLLDTPVVSRTELSATATPGPLIVEEYDSTTVVPPGATVRIDAHHNLLITMPVQP
jgi:N-methylhydantoinase A